MGIQQSPHHSPVLRAVLRGLALKSSTLFLLDARDVDGILVERESFGRWQKVRHRLQIAGGSFAYSIFAVIDHLRSRQSPAPMLRTTARQSVERTV